MDLTSISASSSSRNPETVPVVTVDAVTKLCSVLRTAVPSCVAAPHHGFAVVAFVTLNDEAGGNEKKVLIAARSCAATILLIKASTSMNWRWTT